MKIREKVAKNDDKIPINLVELYCDYLGEYKIETERALILGKRQHIEQNIDQSSFIL